MRAIYHQDLQTRQNEDFVRTWKIESEAGIAKNLAGIRFRLQARPPKAETPLVIDADTTTQYLSVADGGLVTLDVPDEIMNGVAAGVYRYDLLMIEGTRTLCIMEGTLRVLDGVTT